MKKKAQKETIDPRVMHAGKAGAHKARNLNVCKGRCRKPKRQCSKANRWRSD